jgi:hypothetical protein
MLTGLIYHDTMNLNNVAISQSHTKKYVISLDNTMATNQEQSHANWKCPFTFNMVLGPI